MFTIKSIITTELDKTGIEKTKIPNNMDYSWECKHDSSNIFRDR